MGKREFIEKNMIDICGTIGGRNEFADCIRDSVKAVIDNAKSVTEQDIVKPYLELLLKEMQSLEEINKSDDRYDKGYQHGRASCEAMVMHMIGNLSLDKALGDAGNQDMH